MSKIFSKYENGLDKAWYDSSNILYSECDDKENELKVVRITFKDGRTYEYKDVNVHEYLKFREAPSQGSIFAKSIKNNPCTRIEGKNVDSLQSELKNLLEPSSIKKITLSEETIGMKYGNDEDTIQDYQNKPIKEIISSISSFFNIAFEHEINNNI